MIWNHDISQAPRDGSHVILAMPNKTTLRSYWCEPKNEPAHWCMLSHKNEPVAWMAWPEHPFAESPRKVAEAGSESDGNAVGRPTSERQPVMVGSEDDGVTGGESAATQFYLEDVGGGA